MKPSILVIDDSEEILLFLKKKLERVGFQVETVSDGEAALKLLDEAKESFDVILLDQMMPGIDGIATFGKIRASGCISPVIMLTAFGSLSLAVSFLKMGGSDFLEKPIETEILEVKLRNIIKSSKVCRSVGKLESEKVVLKAVIKMTEDIVHEINNPLNTIFTTVSILDEKYPDDDHAEIVGKMKRSMNSIHEVVLNLEHTIAERMQKLTSIS